MCRSLAANNPNVLLGELEKSTALDPNQMSDVEAKSVYDDNIHFTPEGYDRIGEIVYTTIEPYLSTIVK